jgi:hypothetical protein
MLQNRPNVPFANPNTSPVPPQIIPPQPPIKPPDRPRMGRGNLIILVLAALFFFERLAPEDYKISTLVGGFTGHEEAVALRTRLAETQATVAAQNEENARMQQEVEHYKALLDRRTKAYETLYQRTNMMAQAYANVAQQFLTMKQQFLQQTQTGRVTNIVGADLMAGLAGMFGYKDASNRLHQYGQNARSELVGEVDAEMKRNLSQMSADIAQWNEGLPDPAAIVRDDYKLAETITPEPRKPAPPKPGAYRETPLEPPQQTAAARGATVAQRISAPASASAGRWARVNHRFSQVLLRSEPSYGENVVCVLSQDAVVRLLEGADSQSYYAEKGITFVHVRVNWAQHGDVTGWISERALDEAAGLAEEGVMPQPCALPQ